MDLERRMNDDTVAPDPEVNRPMRRGLLASMLLGGLGVVAGPAIDAVVRPFDNEYSADTVVYAKETKEEKAAKEKKDKEMEIQGAIYADLEKVLGQIGLASKELDQAKSLEVKMHLDYLWRNHEWDDFYTINPHDEDSKKPGFSHVGNLAGSMMNIAFASDVNTIKKSIRKWIEEEHIVKIVRGMTPEENKGKPKEKVAIYAVEKGGKWIAGMMNVRVNREWDWKPYRAIHIPQGDGWGRALPIARKVSYSQNSNYGLPIWTEFNISGWKVEERKEGITDEQWAKTPQDKRYRTKDGYHIGAIKEAQIELYEVKKEISQEKFDKLSERKKRKYRTLVDTIQSYNTEHVKKGLVDKKNLYGSKLFVIPKNKLKEEQKYIYRVRATIHEQGKEEFKYDSNEIHFSTTKNDL